MRRGGLACWLVLGCAAAAAAAPAAGQVDTTRRDTTAVDSLTPRRDTTARDTTAALLPTFAPAVPSGPLPPGTRWSFDADSLVFSNIYTLSDLLAHLPGVFVARGGFYGQTEPVFFGGRGARGLEIYWDGVPYLPLGRDSVLLDPARISLAPLERVEVEPLPAGLRVYLVPERPRSTVPRSAVGVVTGDINIARYAGSFFRRWRSGLGLSLVADWNTHDGARGTSSSPFRTVDLWLKAEYVPNPRMGVSYQILSSSWRRSASGSNGRVDPWELKRQDRMLRVFFAARDDGLGPRFQATLAHSATDAEVLRDTAAPARTITQAQLEAGQVWRRAQLALTARFADHHRPDELEARGSWVPIAGLTVAADARHARNGLDRPGDRAHLAAGVELPWGFSAHGDLVAARETPAVALSTAPPQKTTDLSGAVRWTHRLATLELGRGRRSAFTPAGGPQGLKTVGGLGATPSTDYVKAQVVLRPVSSVQLAATYFDPVRGGGDFEPPHHARVSAAFFSKFWRVFRSGTFALRGEFALESWSGGLGGLDTLTGGQLRLTGSTFAETNIEMQIGDVTILWIIRNVNGMRNGYVPGLPYPHVVRFYGVRWTFFN